MFSVRFSSYFGPWTLGRSRTLGVALNLRETEQILNAAREGIFNDDIIFEEHSRALDLSSVVVSDLWGPQLLYDFWTGISSLHMADLPTRAIELATQYLILQREAAPHIGGHTNEIRSITRLIASDGVLQSFIALSVALRRAVEFSLPSRNKMRVAKSHERRAEIIKRYSKFHVRGTSLVFYFTASIVIVDYHDHLYACSHDHLLCYASKVDTHVSYRVMMHWACKTYCTALDKRLMCELIRELHATHIAHDQEFFRCAKVLDGVCQAYFLMSADIDGPSNDLMYRQIVEDSRSDPVVSKFISSIGKLLKNMSAAALIETSSLGKCSGHPSVDVDAGLAQLYERTTNIRRADRVSIMKSVIALKKQYVLNYISKNGRWPPLSGTPSSAVRKLVQQDAHPDGPTAANLNIRLTEEDWIQMDFRPTAKLQPVTSLLPFIKDRTICMTRDEILSTYESVGLDVDFTKQTALNAKEVYEKTALVLYVLLTQSLLPEFRAFLDNVVRAAGANMSSVQAYLVCKLVPKEGELKTLARLFGEKTFSYRLYSMVQEITSAEFLSEYFPNDQAMTSGEVELKKRLTALTTMPPLSPNHVYVYLVVDVSGWNSGFRRETVRPIGRVLDQIHGTSVFSKTQDLYARTLFLSKQGSTVRGWDGQAGGIEGLNQDTWVIVYLAQMHAIFSQFKYKYHFMDMGDNFVAKVAVPRQEIDDAGNAAQFAMNLSRRLGLKLSLYGHDVKPDETTCSPNAFIFCHTYRVRGIQMSGQFRKAAKMSGTNDSFFPLLDDYIGCAFSNAHATAEQGYLTCGPYHCASIWAFIHALTCVWRADQTTQVSTFSSLSNAQLLALMFVPNVMGGFPIIYLETMYLRSEADHLPQFIRLWRYLQVHRPNVARPLEFVVFQRRDPRASLMTLLADPRALALTKPQGPSAILNRELDGRLSQTAENEEIKAMYSVYNEQSERLLVNSLAHNTTWPARLLAAMFGASGFAIRRSLIACFESSRTAIAFLLKTKPYMMSTPVVCRRALLAERRLMGWRLALVLGQRRVIPYTTAVCPVIMAEDIRKYHWQREITTITSPPMGHLFRMQGEHQHASGESYIIVRLGTICDRVSEYCDHMVMGPYEPYIGHTTSSATRSRLRITRSKDALIDGTLNLAVVKSWAELVDEDGSLCRLIDILLGAYTDTDATTLQQVSGVRSHGTIEHHLRSRGFNPTIAANSVSSILSMVTADSKYCVAFQQGKKYAVNFLEEMLYAEYSLLDELQYQRKLTNTDTNHSLVLETCECFRELELHRITVRDIPGLERLKHTVLSRQTRLLINSYLTDAINEVGAIGTTSHIDHKPSDASIGIVIAYWAQLVQLVQVLSIGTESNAYDWERLANLRGATRPKSLSVNVIRRCEPKTLLRVLKIMDQAAWLFDPRRSTQIQPVIPSVHSPHSTALNEICTLITGGNAHGPLMDEMDVVPEAIIFGVTPLYQAVWALSTFTGLDFLPSQLFLPADIDVHPFNRILQFCLATRIGDQIEFVGNQDQRRATRVYNEFTELGSVVINTDVLCDCCGAEHVAPVVHDNPIQWDADGDPIQWESVLSSASIEFHRVSPTVLHDSARSGRILLRARWPTHLPESPMVHVPMRGFGKSQALFESVRHQPDLAYDPDPVLLDEACLEVWHSTTRSPSRMLFTFHVLGLQPPPNWKIAVVGDGIGGISNMLGTSSQNHVVFYSTKYIGPNQEQGPEPFVNRYSTVSAQYMQINLRDVTADIWDDTLQNRPELIPNLLVSDAELDTFEGHEQSIDCLGKVLSSNPGMILMIRVRAIRVRYVALLVTRLLKYCSQVQYVPVPSLKVKLADGYIVGRYGHAVTNQMQPTFDTINILYERCIEVRESNIGPRVVIETGLGLGLSRFPALTPLITMDVNAAIIMDPYRSAQLVSQNVSDVMDSGGVLDIANIKKLFPFWVALAPGCDAYRRCQSILYHSYDRYVHRGTMLRKVILSFVNLRLIPHEHRLTAEEEAELGDEI